MGFKVLMDDVAGMDSFDDFEDFECQVDYLGGAILIAFVEVVVEEL